MKFEKYKAPLFIGIFIILFILISLIFRVKLPYDSVFVDSWVKFTSNDAYYHMRLVDSIVHNFPHLTAFDPYIIFPGGGSTAGVHFMDYLLATIIWIIGLGHPTQHLIDAVGAWFPAVLAALTVIPVFFIGKALFNRWVGLMAAFLVAIFPGEFLGRSILGFTDNHVVETFFSTIAALFVILAVKSAGEKIPKFENLRDWKIMWKPLLYGVLGGFFLGLYLVTWIGALLFVFIFAVFFLIQFIINHLNHKSNDYLGFTGLTVFLIAGLIFLPQSSTSSIYKIAVGSAILMPPVLALISKFMSKPKMHAAYYPLALVGLGIIVLLIMFIASPATLNTLTSNFKSVFLPGGGSTATTTMEMQPFLFPSNDIFSTRVAWGNFTTSFFMFRDAAIPGFGFISLAVLIVLAVMKRGRQDINIFFIIWSLIILIATLVQRRFAYYLVVNLAVLSAYISWAFWNWVKGFIKADKTPANRLKEGRLAGIVAGLILGSLSYCFTKDIYTCLPIWLAGYASLLFGCWCWAKLKERSSLWALFGFLAPIGLFPIAILSKPAKPVVKKKSGTSDKQKTIETRVDNAWVSGASTIFAVLLVFTFVAVWNVDTSRNVARGAPYAPTDGWMQALEWVRDNTPEPLGDPNAYDTLYPLDYKYPASAYGVTTWWDYGYWVQRIARRLPSVNPSQEPGPIIQTANLFLSMNATQSDKLMNEMKSNYIIADSQLITSKLWAVANWAGQSQNKYFHDYYAVQNNALRQYVLYTPEFYRTLVVRLFCFDGKAITDSKPIVVTYEVQNGRRMITKIEQYTSYAAAQAYIAAQKTGNYDIIGSNPFVSIVPLEAVTNFKEVFASPAKESFSGNITVSDIKVFQHIK